jgi:hypothetical protein
MEYIKWSAKAIWALIVPLLITFIQANQEAAVDWAVGVVGAAITALLVWLQKNGPAPS